MQTLGIVDIVWRGLNIEVEKGSKIRLPGLKNNAVTFGRRVGRAAEYAGGEVTATTHLKRGQRLSDIYTSEEGELQVICDTGQTITCPDAFMMDDIPEATGGEGGKLELKWGFGDYEEIVT